MSVSRERTERTSEPLKMRSVSSSNLPTWPSGPVSKVEFQIAAPPRPQAGRAMVEATIAPIEWPKQTSGVPQEFADMP